MVGTPPHDVLLSWRLSSFVSFSTCMSWYASQASLPKCYLLLYNKGNEEADNFAKGELITLPWNLPVNSQKSHRNTDCRQYTRKNLIICRDDKLKNTLDNMTLLTVYYQLRFDLSVR